MLKIRLSFILFFLFCYSHAQNLVTNGDFEEFSQKLSIKPQEGRLTGKHINIAIGWKSTDIRSWLDYYNKQLEEEYLSKKWNGESRAGKIFAKSGNSYMGFFSIVDNDGGYCQIKLKEKLQKGGIYKLSFYVSTGEGRSRYFSSNIGAFFSENEIIKNERRRLAEYEPQVINSDSNFINKPGVWQKVEGEFVSEGEEEYLVFGVFSRSKDIKYKKNESNEKNITRQAVYLFLDNVILTSKRDIINLLKKDGKITLNNVFFTTGKYQLLDDSFDQLEQLVSYLNNNKEASIEVIGHTDNKGDESNNQILSVKRAEAIKEYLLLQGIETNRANCIGKGEIEPIASNETEEGREKNRRVEIKVTD